MLTAGTVPASSDLVPLGQGGGNTAVTYGQFMSGLAGIANVDVSQLLVTPTGGKSPSKLGDLAANTLTLTGGTLTGTLTLAADPTSLQAATKKYVDAQVGTALPKIGGTLSGALTLAADPTTSLQAATKQYVDGQVATAVPRDWRHAHRRVDAGGRSREPAAGSNKAVCRYACIARRRHTHRRAGARRRSDVPLQAATKGYVDTQVAGALPKAGGTLTGALTLAADPTLSMHAATKHYVDAQAATSLPIGGGTLTGPLALPSNPASACKRLRSSTSIARSPPHCRSPVERLPVR